METLYQESPYSASQDLKVTLQDSILVFRSQETDKKSIFLSNVDQPFNFNIETVHFFNPKMDFPPQVVVNRLKIVLEKVLVTYDFLAGRLKLNSQSGRLEIDCNAAGAVFVVASSEFALDEIGDLDYPNPAFRQLIIQSLENLGPNDQPLSIFQVTSFKCGGFAISISTNHVLFDGMSFKIFLQNLASLAFDDKPLAIVPFKDRCLIASRSPPHVAFTHPELYKLELPIDGVYSCPPLFESTQEDLDFKIFRLSSNDISYLKNKANANGTRPSTRITGFNVVTAHVWRCKPLSRDVEKNKERVSTLLYTVNIRSRLKPPLPLSYCGNAVISAYASAKCGELEEKPFFELVDMVSEGAARLTDEYVRSFIDWHEIYKGFVNGEFLISSWWILGFAKVEYPWDKPRYSCPLVQPKKDIILFLPNIDGVNNDGVNILVALPAKEMEKFQFVFHKFMERSP